ncbi:hypothetical protein BU25DRAFT_374521 [Macroventuria anomochaeta]|uniref:Uncharacterized protein n=1 Tax=Macroventuria anomochaeta TaxID=301207 RepID=A0ACB6RSR4_9PLEO|nr:uncharacterized protein BU25DRAFT_374521 [Macroventuria anomochaeta]KAF2624179.1 hypothetical protein BU25DRAFT_374521 [Macroventuria anomochaeta]
MAHDENLPDKPEVTFDFNLPHGIDVEENTLPSKDLTKQPTITQDPDDGDDAPIQDLFFTSDPGMSGHEDTEQDLNYRQFSLDFSDYEGSERGFERSWPSHQAKKQAAKAARGKKSPRRSDAEGDDSDSGTRAKKPRPFLFGGPEEDMENEEQVDNLFAPATPGRGIGNRMSSLNLDQQQNGDEDMERPINTGFGFACSDIGSVHDSSVPSDDEFVKPPNTVAHYELRQNINHKKALTHVDTDKSGNWDPEQEAKEKAAKLVRAKATKREKKKKKKKKKDKSDTFRDYTMKCIVKLPFDAFGNVRNITNDQQNWPEDWSDIDSEQERELEEHREAYRHNTPDRGLQLPLEDPAGEVDDLTGHPAARGCKQCRKLEQACSIVKGGKYPCEECVEDGGECQPIREPIAKGRCKQCDQAQEEVCSFEDDPTQPICDHCADNDHICEALPPDGYKAPRVDLEEIAYGPDRPYAACTACRIFKKRCSLKDKEDQPPCKNCKKNNLGCTFYHLPKQDSEKQTAEKKTLIEKIAPEVAKFNSESFTAEDLAGMDRRNNEVLEREPTPELEMEDAEGNKGMLTKITTSFAHPIRFGVERSTLSDCNFCELPIFGMVGHFEREVHVIRWHSGLGYAEVGGGHCQNTGETTMCTECTNQRLQILICPGHEFERIPDATSDYNALTEELAEAETGGADMQYQLSRWCSMCFSPATFGCSTVQPDLCGDEEKEIAGCHLRLCTACEKALRIDYGGNFDHMAAVLESQPKISEADETLGTKIKGRPRADVGLLMENGLLMRKVQAEG